VTRFTLLHSSRIPGELPPPVILDPMVSFAAEHPEKFNLHIFVDEDDDSQPPAQVTKKLVGRISEGSLKHCIGAEDQPPPSWWDIFSRKQAPKAPEKPKRRILFLVCGPEAYVLECFAFFVQQSYLWDCSMIGAIAGPFGRNLSQGPVGGILGKMGYTSNEVYKL
jgi:cytochrome-b5 reductase